VASLRQAGIAVRELDPARPLRRVHGAQRSAAAVYQLTRPGAGAPAGRFDE
jgi:hypothetical protein